MPLPRYTDICNLIRAKEAKIQVIVGVFVSSSKSTALLLPSSLRGGGTDCVAETRLVKACFPLLAIVLSCSASKTPAM